jgi:hypothetical protein
VLNLFHLSVNRLRWCGTNTKMASFKQIKIIPRRNGLGRRELRAIELGLCIIEAEKIKKNGTVRGANDTARVHVVCIFGHLWAYRSSLCSARVQLTACEGRGAVTARAGRLPLPRGRCITLSFCDFSCHVAHELMGVADSLHA